MLGAVLALTLTASASENDSGKVSDLLAEQAVEARVVTIGHRLAASAGDLCPQVPIAGIQIHDASQYAAEWDPALAQAFGTGPWPKVLAVAQGGAAERAGVQANDSILAIDGRPIPAARGRGNYGRVQATLALLDSALADGRVVLSLERDGRPLTVDLAPDHGCASHFQIKVSGALRSRADGDYVEVNTGLVAFAPDDGQLAAGIAHELAHNVLHHRAELDAEGIKRGFLQNFGRNARLTRATEAEADRFSVYLLDRAGYPLAAAITFWERLYGRMFLVVDPTHPGGKERVALVRGEIARIDAARAKGETPVFKP